MKKLLALAGIASLLAMTMPGPALAQTSRPTSPASASLIELAREFVLAQDKGSAGWEAFSKARGAQWMPGSDVLMGSTRARSGAVPLGSAGRGEVLVMAEQGRLQTLNVQIVAGQGRPFTRAGFSGALATHLPGLNPTEVRAACPDEADGMASSVYRIQVPGAGPAHVMVFSVIEPGKTEPLTSGFSFSRKLEHDWLCEHDHGPGSDHRH